MSTDSIVGYTYDTETLCPECTIDAMVLDRTPFPPVPEEILDFIADQVMNPPINRQDESSFDSNIFPKIIMNVQVEGSEKCDHCGEELIQ